MNFIGARLYLKKMLGFTCLTIDKDQYLNDTDLLDCCQCSEFGYRHEKED